MAKHPKELPQIQSLLNLHSISDIADSNLNYKTTVVFDSGANIIGNIVDVEITIDT